MHAVNLSSVQDRTVSLTVAIDKGLISAAKHLIDFVPSFTYRLDGPDPSPTSWVGDIHVSVWVDFEAIGLALLPRFAAIAADFGFATFVGVSALSAFGLRVS
jgi:hypothetical protein